MSVPVVLIPGAGGRGWSWHLVEAGLRERGYDAFAVDLPADDEGQGLPAYADAVVGAIGEHASPRPARAQRVEHQFGGERAGVGHAAVDRAERPGDVVGEQLEPGQERVGVRRAEP